MFIILVSSGHDASTASKTEATNHHNITSTITSAPTLPPAPDKENKDFPAVQATASPTKSPVDSPPLVETSSPTLTPVSTPQTDPPDTKPVADELVLFGERHSGLQWYADKLKECYPDHKISTQLTRETLWFQDHPPDDDDLTTLVPPRRVFVLVVRNVYDWVEAMRQSPLDAPDHRTKQGEPLPWMDFVQQAWKPLGNLTDNDDGPTTTCQLGFTPEQVVPCTVDDDDDDDDAPTYELNPNGEAFDSILALRTAKLRHFTAHLPLWWPNVVQNTTLILRYAEGPNLPVLDAALGWTHVCDATDDANALIMQDATQPLRNYTKTELVYLKENIDWEVEQSVGFNPKPEE